MAMDFFYDGQMRRYWMQFSRIFEGWQYESGIGADGVKTLRSFPVSMGNKNRQISHLLRNNSENAILSTPRITCEMTGFSWHLNVDRIPITSQVFKYLSVPLIQQQTYIPLNWARPTQLSALWLFPMI